MTSGRGYPQQPRPLPPPTQQTSPSQNLLSITPSTSVHLLDNQYKLEEIILNEQPTDLLKYVYSFNRFAFIQWYQFNTVELIYLPSMKKQKQKTNKYKI